VIILLFISVNKSWTDFVPILRLFKLSNLELIPNRICFKESSFSTVLLDYYCFLLVFRLNPFLLSLFSNFFFIITLLLYNFLSLLCFFYGFIFHFIIFREIFLNFSLVLSTKCSVKSLPFTTLLLLFFSSLFKWTALLWWISQTWLEKLLGSRYIFPSCPLHHQHLTYLTDLE